MFYAHYFAVVCNGCNDEFAWHGFVNDCQGVVACYFKLFRHIFKDFGWVYLFGLGYGATEYFADGLVTKAYAEDWEFSFAFA